MLLPLGPAVTLATLVQAALSLVPLDVSTPTHRATDSPPTAAPTSSAARSADGSRTGFVAPLRGELVVLDRFRPPDRPWLPGHRGVDLDAAPGDQVLAAGAGIVLWAGDLAGRGVISVLHGDGRRTTYEPVTALVGVGDEVRSGTALGVLAAGVSHCGGIPSCLHWGLVTADEGYADPLTLIGRAGRPRLLPTGVGATP
jgi:murein DD-endopeptidase MepM/ murein hydrolase activator NlpD